MLSMTGYGKSVAEADGRKITVELKSVNHRFLDLTIKLPRALNFCEDAIRSVIREKCSRGHIDVFVNYENKRDDAVQMTLNSALAAELIRLKSQVVDEFGLADDFTVSALLRTPDVVAEEKAEEDEAAILSLVIQSTAEAADKLNEMRAVEGTKLKTDLSEKVDTVEALVEKLSKRAPMVVENYRIKLTEKIRDALCDVATDEARLLNEVAFFCDRAAIDEEITRLRSHVAQARIIFKADEPVGRKLDFLVQEMGRESNTISSKSNDLTVTELALMLKSEIEKIREQVQNVE